MTLISIVKFMYLLFAIQDLFMMTQLQAAYHVLIFIVMEITCGTALKTHSIVALQLHVPHQTHWIVGLVVV